MFILCDAITLLRTPLLNSAISSSALDTGIIRAPSRKNPRPLLHRMRRPGMPALTEAAKEDVVGPPCVWSRADNAHRVLQWHCTQETRL